MVAIGFDRVTLSSGQVTVPRMRRRNVFVYAVAAGFGVLLGACYPKTAPAPGALTADSVTWASEKWPGTTEPQLAAGHDLFLAKCNGCHGYPDLNDTSDDEWPSIAARMAD